MPSACSVALVVCTFIRIIGCELWIDCVNDSDQLKLELERIDFTHEITNVNFESSAALSPSRIPLVNEMEEIEDWIGLHDSTRWWKRIFRFTSLFFAHCENFDWQMNSGRIERKIWSPTWWKLQAIRFSFNDPKLGESDKNTNRFVRPVEGISSPFWKLFCLERKFCEF